MMLREKVWEAMVYDNPNLDGVLKTAFDQVMPVVEKAVLDASQEIPSGLQVWIPSSKEGGHPATIFPPQPYPTLRAAQEACDKRLAELNGFADTDWNDYSPDGNAVRTMSRIVYYSGKTNFSWQTIELFEVTP